MADHSQAHCTRSESQQTRHLIHLRNWVKKQTQFRICPIYFTSLLRSWHCIFSLFEQMHLLHLSYLPGEVEQRRIQLWMQPLNGTQPLASNPVAFHLILYPSISASPSHLYQIRSRLLNTNKHPTVFSVNHILWLTMHARGTGADRARPLNVFTHLLDAQWGERRFFRDMHEKKVQ